MKRDRDGVYKVGKICYISFTADGSRHRKAVSTSLTEAREALAARKADILRGEYRFTRETNIRFKDFKDEYLEFVKAKGRVLTHLRKSDRDVLLRHELSLKNLARFFNDKPLSRINSNDIEAYKRKRQDEFYRERPIRGATINRELACLRNLINVAQKKEKFFGKNPVKKEDFFVEHPKAKKVLSSAELNRFITAMNADGVRPHLRLAVILALQIAQRKREILGIKWSDVDFENKEILIGKTKSGDPNKIAMNPLVERELKNLVRKGEYVFMNPRTGRRMTDVKRSFDTLRTKAGLPDLRFHDLRHNAASFMHRSGASIKTIQKFLGHKSPRTTEIYLHSFGEDERRAAEKQMAIFDKKPDSIVTPSSQEPVESKTAVH